MASQFSAIETRRDELFDLAKKALQDTQAKVGHMFNRNISNLVQNTENLGNLVELLVVCADIPESEKLVLFEWSDYGERVHWGNDDKSLKMLKTFVEHSFCRVLRNMIRKDRLVTPKSIQSIKAGEVGNNKTASGEKQPPTNPTATASVENKQSKKLDLTSNVERKATFESAKARTKNKVLAEKILTKNSVGHSQEVKVEEAASQGAPESEMMQIASEVDKVMSQQSYKRADPVVDKLKDEIATEIGEELSEFIERDLFYRPLVSQMTLETRSENAKVEPRQTKPVKSDRKKDSQTDRTFDGETWVRVAGMAVRPGEDKVGSEIDADGFVLV